MDHIDEVWEHPTGQIQSNPTLSTQIDKYTSRLAWILAKARRLKNTFLPINRLPPEVLGLMPTFFQDDRDLISATAVCAYWRITLLSTPTLWCNINARSASMVNAYLERSGQVPLHVKCLASRQVASLLRPRMDRIASLDINHDVLVGVPRAAKDLREPAPMLNMLSFSAHGDELWVLSIPPHFLGASFPSLRTLVLTGIYFLAGPFTFQSVTTLIWTASSNFTDQILRTLDRLPSLEAATIHFHPLCLPSSTQPDRNITLQNLRTLVLTANSDPKKGPCGFILPILLFTDLPSIRKLSFQVGGCSSSHASPLRALSPERLPRLSQLQEAEISLLEGTSARIRLSGSPQFELTISFEDVSDVKLTNDYFGGIPSQSLRKLTVIFYKHSSSKGDRWALDVMKLVHGMEVLEVAGERKEFLNIWHGEGEYHRICPLLRGLSVSGGADPGPEISALVDLRNSVDLPLTASYECG